MIPNRSEKFDSTHLGRAQMSGNYIPRLGHKMRRSGR